MSEIGTWEVGKWNTGEQGRGAASQVECWCCAAGAPRKAEARRQALAGAASLSRASC